jgi:AcrR family transcriptional regulator
MSGKQAPKTAKREETRRKLLDSADVLFYEEGIRATVVEALDLRESQPADA